jgi:hypothetical protein
MVMLTRGWAKFLVLVGFALEMFGAVVSIASAEDDEPVENEWSCAIQRQPVEQAPPPASMLIGNRYIHAEPQNYPKGTVNDDWMLGTQPVMLRHIAARRMPVVYQQRA